MGLVRPEQEISWAAMPSPPVLHHYAGPSSTRRALGGV